jgi:hypothetical protein
MNNTTLAQYIADFIDYEISEKGKALQDISAAMIQKAIEAYEGGAR